MKKHVPFLVAFLIGALIMFSVCASKNVFGMTETARVMRVLCDGAFLAAVLLCGCGLLVMVANNGIFDTISYASRTILSYFIPSPGPGRNPETFAEYRQRKHQKPGSFGFMVLAGSIYLTMAFIFLLIFEHLSS